MTVTVKIILSSDIGAPTENYSCQISINVIKLNIICSFDFELGAFADTKDNDIVKSLPVFLFVTDFSAWV